MRAGEAVALLGGNGSGKSTLVRALLGLLPHQRGAVRLFGLPLRSSGVVVVRLLPQRSVALFGGSKVKEVVAAGDWHATAHPGRWRRADREAVHEAIALVGLSEARHRHRNPVRRAATTGAVARAPRLTRICSSWTSPRLVLISAPAGARRRVAGRLSAGTALLVVLHDVGPLGTLIDRAVVLSDGRVAHDGSLGDLGQHHRRLGGHEHLDHGRSAADDHGEGADGWLGGAVEP